ncbi:MAG TPA: DUF6789 family protein [Actinomycetota bacterium]
MDPALDTERRVRPNLVHSGTPETRSTHHPVWGPIGLMLSMAVPIAVIVVGVAVEGSAAISWQGAIVWGVVATVAFTILGMVGTAMGMTRMDLLDLLGSAVATPHTTGSRVIGAVIHHMNGAVLAVAFVYAGTLVGLSPDWIAGLVWGAILWALALLMMTTIGSVHPAIRRGQQEDPGPAGVRFGAMTPVGSLMGHLVYGALLGLLYQAWPLA